MMGEKFIVGWEIRKQSYFNERPGDTEERLVEQAKSAIKSGAVRTC